MKNLYRLTMTFVLIFTVAVTTQSIASAAPGDPIEVQQQQCADSGGTWNNLDNTCISEEDAAALGDCGNKTLYGIPKWYKYLGSDSIAGKCKPVISTVSDLLLIALAVFEGALSLAGIVAAIMVFIGGFNYVLAQGEADKAAGGRKTVINAIIGLVIIILSVRVISFIGSTFGA